MDTINELMHDQLAEQVFDKATTVVLLPGEMMRLEIAINKQIGYHHSEACMARMNRDTKLIEWHEREYEELCHLYERIYGTSPLTSG